MTPALTKIFKDGCGIHACASSLRMDSEGTTGMCRSELKTPLDSVDDEDLQKLLPLLSSFPVDVLAGPAFSLSQDQLVLLPCASPLPRLLTVGVDAARSQQDASVLPGGSDMFEGCFQETCLLYGRGPVLTHGPGGGDVPRPPPLHLAPSVYSRAQTKHQGDPPVVVPTSAGPPGCLSPPSQQPLGSRWASEGPNALKSRLTRQEDLQSKAQRLQKRLQLLLGEHAVQHCSQQLSGLKRRLDAGPQRGRRLAADSGPDPSADSSSFPELGDLVQSNRAVLRGLQAALDSEATLSSSSDEEHEENDGCSTTADLGSWWLQERAELGSRWSWLQVRLAELEQRMRQTEELHLHIRSTKGKVVLAESQPLTDMQIQQTLLREMAGLSCTAKDTDNEPCSPTRLLYNIERQSAQLSQFVNSLMPPLSFSPAKQAHSCKRQKVFPSGRTNGAFPPRSSNRRRLLSARSCRAEMSCVCARTRPLVSFHKPRLFAPSASGPTCLQDSGKSPSPLSSSRWSDNLGREEWSLRPLTDEIQPHRPAQPPQRSTTPLHSSHKLYNRHRRRPSRRVLDLSTIEVPGSSIQAQNGRANRKKRKQRRIPRPIDDEEFLSQLSDTKDSSDGFPEQRLAKGSSRQTPQGFVGKRQGESIYNINNIVIHTLVAKIEKLQYKDIITPSWRVSDPSPVIRKQTVDEEGQEEDLADHVFAQRHLALERRERSPRTSWGARKHRKHRKRCGSRAVGHGGGMLTSGEESSAERRWAQLDSDEEQRSEEWPLWSPWERRMFPLNEDEEKALSGDDSTDKTPERPSECGFYSETLKNSNSQFSPSLFTGASLPSGGQNKNS